MDWGLLPRMGRSKFGAIRRTCVRERSGAVYQVCSPRDWVAKWVRRRCPVAEMSMVMLSTLFAFGIASPTSEQGSH
jgi:hypothetical protein